MPVASCWSDSWSKGDGDGVDKRVLDELLASADHQRDVSRRVRSAMRVMRAIAQVRSVPESERLVESLKRGMRARAKALMAFQALSPDDLRWFLSVTGLSYQEHCEDVASLYAALEGHDGDAQVG